MLPNATVPEPAQLRRSARLAGQPPVAASAVVVAVENGVDRAFANTAKAYRALNLAPDGSPLTYSKAKKGPDAPSWFQAEGEELARLMDTSTIKPILLSEQPMD